MSELRPLVAAEFAALAAALEREPATAWSQPSLCEGWSVGHVVAHLTMAVRYPADRFQAELAADDFDFQRMSDRLAARDAVLPTADLLDDLRSETMATFEQPGGGWVGSLSHVVIHGLDVTLPLRLGRVSGDEAAVLVLDGLVSGGEQTGFGVPIDAALRATDVGWHHGDGAGMQATAGELIAHLSGRQVAGAPWARRVAKAPGEDGAPVLPFRDADAFDAWLADHHDQRDGVWLKLAKVSSGIPSMTSDEAVDVGLCWGWISGQRRSLDKSWYLQKYVPRRPRSNWSALNVRKVGELTSAGRMRPPGIAEVEAARADGRWDAAAARPGGGA